MQYIIDHAMYISEGQEHAVSMLIKDNEIRYFGEHVPNLPVIKMDARSFFITPSFVIFAPDIPHLTFDQFKTYFSDQFILKGCSTILTTFDIKYEFEFDKKLLEKRTSMLNSPVDYIIGLKVPAEKITASLVRKCKTAKIPAIFIEFTKIKDLATIPWGWIKEASFPYNPVFIPTFPPRIKLSRQLKTSRKWDLILLKEKISHISQPLPVNKPLNAEIIKKLGLYPKKGIFTVGGEVSYNLFLKSSKLDDYLAPSYETTLPEIAVKKGKITSINRKALFRPGSGEEVIINKTALFV
ncbi:hypothetical protein [Lederbergia citrea]|uniref:hypothetical protein n=1 Tax=Lederbergia citrea TaxID=2833581 RepID=UPI001BCA0BB3|nr:hypothetical protein [Lederbergia citrea]MBS4203129.1 hypothetical protein [Lederbergia citrea]